MHNIVDADAHGLLEFKHPVFNIFLHWVDHVHEHNLLLLWGNDAVNFKIGKKFNLIDSFKALLKVGLNSFDVFGLGENG